jgi:hypothetical protein
MDIYFPEKYIMEMLKIIKPRTDHHVQFVHKIYFRAKRNVLEHFQMKPVKR